MPKNTHIYPHRNTCRITLATRSSLTILTFILFSACQSGPQSAVTDQSATRGGSPGASPSTAASAPAGVADAGTSPAATVPAQAPGSTPRQPDAFATPAGSSGRGGSMLGSMQGVTTAPYKPTPTPGDPFPPRPTPTLSIKDGKPVQEWQAPPEALALTNPIEVTKEAVAIGQSLYNQRCVDCHGKKGYGNGGMSRSVKKPPTNLASRMVQANSDGELFWKITNGRSPMPANRVRFDDEQRWYIVTFLRTLK